MSSPELPKNISRSDSLKKSLHIVFICVSLGMIVTYLTFTFLTPSQGRYEISVDPILVRDSLDTETHVVIKNIGTDPLTNVRVTYGGTAKPDLIATLNSGQKITLSPPEGSDLTRVTVTADQGIKVTKDYRIPTSALFDHL